MTIRTPAQIPPVHRLLAQAAGLVAEHGHSLVAREAKALLEQVRADLLLGTAQHHPGDLRSALAQRVHSCLAPHLRPVFNLTGTVIHTNLGRALLPQDAVPAVTAAMLAPTNLEFDLAAGQRGEREDAVEALLRQLTGAEAATVVNNNAAAVLLTLSALAAGRECVVSRGELVEIGGGFRMPDVMASAGVRLVEVGTTNRTHPADYRRAIGAATALLLKVHTSNYRVEGFTASVGEAELAGIAREHGLPLASDLGAGCLVDLSPYGLPREPMPQDMLAAGCDVVTFSGDKLLGGPQAGLLVGTRDVIARIRRHPLKRALRVSKLTLAALEATLRLYLRPESLRDTLPTLRLLTRALPDIEATARRFEAALARAAGPAFDVRVMPLKSQIGSGALPVELLPSAGLQVKPQAAKGSGHAVEALARRLRSLPRAVIGRVADGALLLDFRCLEENDFDAFAAQLAATHPAP
ncbi:MAG: L-seryl-tRNA(Sec) selenium transferase [Burkholderiales bacterium]|nr:L-seryl-tRNA(Sec) selenium transferase [Burkholderiales bacterium]